MTMDRKCKVKVVIRVRPPLSDEEKTCVSVSENKVEIFNHRNVTETIQYDFAAVHGMEATQHDIYMDSVHSLIPTALTGQNVSIFAYGPTGAGKTHTMLGTPTNPGVIPRVINSVFERIEENKVAEGNEWDYKVTFSYLEIYNEKVQDLLEPSNNDLPIREDAEKNILIPGLAKKQIHNFDDFKNIFGPASNNRTVAATKLNNRSSRSHSIVQLMVTKSRPCRILHGKIYLIDLAGSEDNRRTGNQGIRLKESGAINKSLFALGEVVDAINSGLPRIPYRNSKLTRLLQDSIGGSCHSLMITNIAPEERYYYDTYCTLNFATKSKKIVNKTIIKETVKKETIGIVKPQIRKVPSTTTVSTKKYHEDDDDEEIVVRKKKPKLLDSSTDSIGESSMTSESQPSYSPLIRRQAELEDTVNRRLQELENNLILQMKAIQPSTTHLPAGMQTPKTKAIQEMQRQLEASNAQLKALASQHMLPPPIVPVAIPTLPVVPTKPVETKPANKILEDKTNKLVVKPVFEEAQPALSKGRPLKGLKRKKDEEFTCSPLFARPPRALKTKTFKSSASISSKDTSVESEDESENKAALTNTVPQQKRNEEFLDTLNTASVKDLQSLQTVGAKRAKLIFEWRQTYGEFSSAYDLAKIPGFSEKFVQKLLHSNFIAVT